MKPLLSRLPLAVAVLVAAGCALPGMTGSAPNQPNGVTVGLKGQMQFDFKYPDPPAQRRLLATIEDVAFYRITIKKPDGSIARGPDLYTAPTPTTRQVSHRVSDLEPGTYTVLIEALDANQAPIGQAQTDVTVVAGQCQLVPITLHLDNDILLPTVGKIGLAVDVQDGAVVQPSTPCCSIPPEYVPLDPAPSSTPTSSPSPVTACGVALPPTPSPPVNFDFDAEGHYFSTSYSGGSTGVIPNALDGDEMTWWGNDYIESQYSWFGESLQQITKIKSIDLVQLGEYGNGINYAQPSLYINISDDLINWTTIYRWDCLRTDLMNFHEHLDIEALNIENYHGSKYIAVSGSTNTHMFNISEIRFNR